MRNNIVRFVIFITMVIPSLMAQAQNLSVFEECDTINIDECYVVRGGKKYSIDTTVHNTIKGDFEILTVNYIDHLDLECCVLSVAHKDTFYTIYDSVLVNDKLIYLVDTSYSTSVYNVLVENVNRLNDSLKKYVRTHRSYESADDNHVKLFHLSIGSFYNKIKIHYDWGKMKENQGNLLTVNCSLCHVIILHGKRKKISDCPLYNNLYRLN